MKQKTKFKIITFGCAANQADSEVMRSLLSKTYEESDNSDILIFNTCGVKGVTENKIVSQIKKTKHKNSGVIIAGCLPKISRKRLEKEFPRCSLIGPDQVLDIKKIVKQVIEGRRVVELSSKYCERLIKTNTKDIEIIPLSQGCFGNCHFCATKFARGTLKSYPIERIVNKIKESKAKTFYLTSQDNGCYGQDINTSLVNLLKEIIKIPKQFKIRVGMMNPHHILPMIDDLIEVYKDDKVIKFLHIPIQSGSDKVLIEMSRRGCVDDFKRIVKKFKDNVHPLTLSTDIIVGYPTETDLDFQKTLNLIQKIKPEVLNISKYYTRPGTKAKNMKQLTSQVVKERSKMLSKMYKTLKES